MGNAPDVQNEWVLTGQLMEYMGRVVFNLNGGNILMLKAPKNDLIKHLLALGTHVHIVDNDEKKCKQIREYFKDSPHALSASQATPNKYQSNDKKLTLHAMTFQQFTPGDIKFSSIFDVGFLPTLPSAEARRHHGDKLDSMVAPNANMALFNIEDFKGRENGDKQALSFYDLSLAFRRGFHIKKLTEVENPKGYLEQLYIAHKMHTGVDFYDLKYAKGYSPWHMTTVNDYLLKHYSFIQPANEKQLRTIFVPMAGKTVDIKWLADKGHQVVAVEISSTACREIFNRDGIKYEETECRDVRGKLMKSLDGKIRVYCCDIFNFTTNVEGEFSSIWERGAVLSFDEEMRKRYFSHMKTLVSKGCLWLTSIFQYDKTVFYGHPYCVNDDELNDTFSDDFTVDLIDETVYTIGQQYTKEQSEHVMVILLRRSNLKSMSDKLYKLSKK